jgi:crotonobetainyl-CoA:carnitine CoA-transferase CaiB-like acyl-CoA transferase
MSGGDEIAEKPRVPQLGEDTDEVLAGLGLGAEEIEALRRDSVI